MANPSRNSKIVTNKQRTAGENEQIADSVGRAFRAQYPLNPGKPLPERFLRLLGQLDEAEATPSRDADQRGH